MRLTSGRNIIKSLLFVPFAGFAANLSSIMNGNKKRSFDGFEPGYL